MNQQHCGSIRGVIQDANGVSRRQKIVNYLNNRPMQSSEIAKWEGFCPTRRIYAVRTVCKKMFRLLVTALYLLKLASYFFAPATRCKSTCDKDVHKRNESSNCKENTIFTSMPVGRGGGALGAYAPTSKM